MTTRRNIRTQSHKTPRNPKTLKALAVAVIVFGFVAMVALGIATIWTEAEPLKAHLTGTWAVVLCVWAIYTTALSLIWVNES